MTRIAMFIALLLSLTNLFAQWDVQFRNKRFTTLYSYNGSLLLSRVYDYKKMVIYRSDDNGNSWDSIGTQNFFHNMIDMGEINDTLFAVSDLWTCVDNSCFAASVFRSCNNGVTWDSIYGNGCGAYRLIVHKNSIFISADKFLKSDDKGNTWIDYTDKPVNGGAIITSIDGVLYTNKLYKSTDDGKTWFSSGNELPGKVAWDIKKNNNYLFIYNDSSVFRSSDDGQNWEEISEGLPVNPIIIDFAISNKNISVLINEKIYVSDNNGKTWIEISGELIEAANKIFYISKLIFKDKFLFAATNDGIWRFDLTKLNTEIRQSTIQKPISFKMEQNFPNPFNPNTSIEYAIGNRQFVTLKIYDLFGREIETLVNEEKPAGTYKVNFDGSNLASGVYIYRLKAKSFDSGKYFTKSAKMILMK